MDGFIPFLYPKYFLFLNKKLKSLPMEENKLNTDDKRDVKEAYKRLGFDWDEDEAFWKNLNNSLKSEPEPEPEKPRLPVTKAPWQTWVLTGFLAR